MATFFFTVCSSGNLKLSPLTRFSFVTLHDGNRDEAIGKRIRTSSTQWEYTILNSYKISIKYVKICH